VVVNVGHVLDGWYALQYGLYSERLRGFSIPLSGSLGFGTPSQWVEASPKSLAGTMGGVQNFGGNVGGIVVSVFTGYILQVTGSFFIALLAGAAAAVLGALSAIILIHPRRESKHGH